MSLKGKDLPYRRNRTAGIISLILSLVFGICSVVAGPELRMVFIILCIVSLFSVVAYSVNLCSGAAGFGFLEKQSPGNEAVSSETGESGEEDGGAGEDPEMVQKPEKSPDQPGSPICPGHSQPCGGQLMAVLSVHERQPAKDAGIVVSYGWCGGMGEAVLQPPEFLNVRFFKDLPVFVTDGRIRSFVQNSAGTLVSGNDPVPPVPGRVRIEGRIRLVKKTRRNESIKGAPLETFWDAEIERLDRIEAWDGCTNGITGIPED